MDISKDFSYESVRVSGSFLDLDREVKNVRTIKRNGCIIDRAFAYTSNGTLADEIVERVLERYANPGLKSRLKAKHFDNVHLMMDALRADLNVTWGQICGRDYWGGVHFQTVERNPPKLSYKFLLPQRNEIKWHLTEFWNDEGPYSATSDLNSVPSEPPYWSSGLLSIQFAIQSTFLELVNKTTDFDVFLQRIPIPMFSNNNVVSFLKGSIFIWSLLVLLTMLYTAKNLVAEKEAGIKSYMMVMGLNPMAFYVSHFLIGFLKVTISIIVCTGIISLGFNHISASLFVVFTIMFGFSSILFAILVSVMVRRPAAALTCLAISWIGLLILDMSMKLSLSNIKHCMLYSLNPFSAYHLGVLSAISFEARMMDLGWFNMFAGFEHSFSFGSAFVMLIFDCILMSFLIFYLDSVLPTDDSPRKHPLFIFKMFNNKSVADSSRKSFRFVDDNDNNGEDVTDENLESERGLNRDEADIDIRKMSKVWSSTGQLAVDNLSFRAFRGQVTVLLGHNGAGKSTTFSVLSGATGKSSGDVLICGESVVSNLSACQQQIGYCPQYNPLFPKLTVREHLKLYANLKCNSAAAGRNLAAKLNETIDCLVRDVQLRPKLDVQAQYLSGGMKRKLCVAMALIGDSRVILLDEPTAGMDPEARHDVGVLLERSKRNRTILLTTHYMDEADSLGNRIGIMVKGRLVCNGSPEFLKHKFGTGYVLSVVIARSALVTASTTPDLVPNLAAHDELQACTSERALFEAAVVKVLDMIHKHAPDARVEKKQSPEFSIIVPVFYKQFFADMFDELESRKEELGVDSFGLSFNTLEQVFLKVGELADQQQTGGDEIDAGRVVQFAADLFRPDEKKVLLLELWTSQLWALFQRHFWSAMRNSVRTFLPFTLTLMMMVTISLVTRDGSSGPVINELSLLSMDTQSVPLQLPESGSPQYMDFPFTIGHMENAHLISIPAVSKLQTALIAHAYDSPPLGIGASVYYNESVDRDVVYALFNGAAHHGPLLAFLLIANSILKTTPDAVNLSLEIYDVSTHSDEVMKHYLKEAGMTIIVIMAFSSFISMLVMPMVEDRQRKFKHQMLLTKLSVVIYWISVVTWCAVLYAGFCGMISGIFLLFGFMRNCMASNIVLWLLYFWCCVPFICCMSFVFESSVRAFSALICWNMVISTFAVFASAAMKQLFSPFVEDLVRRLAYMLLQAYALGEGMLVVSSQCSQMATGELPLAAREKMNVTINPTQKVTAWDALHEPLVTSMILSGLIFWALLCLMQSRKIARMWHQFSCQIRNNVYQMVRNDESADDEDVARERAVVRNTDDAEFTLAVRDVYKYYGKFCAVQNLTFGVRQTDCFGLLGVNGAGKTTTFDILTGVSYASAGSAIVSGVNVAYSPLIGYCPQFDALPLDLTGRETLLLLARLNGFSDAVDRVEKVLWSIHMTEHADKLIQYYSGGQRRRLSIGVTLVSRATLIMLDEPTAGIDPKTRRYIWQLLLAVRQQNVAILLTSHSMEECEALCNRIGFMNKGSLISIGTSQHLKSRYGNSFLLSFTIANPNPATCRFLDILVVKEFQAKPTQDNSSMSTLHWEVPKVAYGAIVTWSQLFRKAQTIAESYTETAHLPPGSETPLIKDFSITQNSLEQVFLRLAEMSAADDDGAGTSNFGEVPPPPASLPTNAPSATNSSSALVATQNA